MKQECSTCRFYMKDEHLCRRFPPTPLVAKIPDPEADAPKITYRSVFPYIESNSWCGEYRPTNAALN